MDKYSEIERAFKEFSNRRILEEKVDDGWFTCRDLAKQKNIHEREAQRVIRKLLDDGMLETRKYHIKTGTRIYPVVHYKLCKKKTR